MLIGLLRRAWEILAGYWVTESMDSLVSPGVLMLMAFREAWILRMVH